MVSERILTFVMPVFGAIAYVTSWLHSIVEVVDKCLESLPRGPAGSTIDGGPAEFDPVTFFGSTSSADRVTVEKIRQSLKVVEMTSPSAARNARLDDNDERRWTDDELEDDLLCAVCLAEIREEEKVYELPHCKHIFHLACLDKWVAHKHSTCPLCRTSLITDSSVATQTHEELDEPPQVLQVSGTFFLRHWFAPGYSMHDVDLSWGGWMHSTMRFAGF